MQAIKDRLKEIRESLAGIIDYSIGFLNKLMRNIRISTRADRTRPLKGGCQDAAQRNLKLRYDRDTGYLGYEVKVTLYSMFLL